MAHSSQRSQAMGSERGPWSGIQAAFGATVRYSIGNLGVVWANMTPRNYRLVKRFRPDPSIRQAAYSHGRGMAWDRNRQVETDTQQQCFAPMAAAARAGALLTTLRKEREALKADDRDAVQLVGSDGIVCVQRLLACSMSPVLRAAFTGPYSESAGSYSLTEHSSATILFAVEHLLGSDSCITNSNSFELLALSYQLDLVPLKAACEAALL